ncbi:MAG: mitomycin antibiotics/polyketide fumonisin biosynthesis protein [Candidatus Latescibacteria bacterium]|nr:mitomycin antibiotics/polyketide fumonisin biosynthesis protein [Candidatus Latescibacterota bacterium]
MDERERFIFDTQGCLLIEDILNPEEVDRLVAGFPRDKAGQIDTEPGTNSAAGLLNYPEPLFRELINHPRLLPYLEALLTDPEGIDYPGYRQFILDHEYFMYLPPGGRGPTFHFGGTPYDPWHSYTVREGKIYCGLLTVVWFLNDAAEGDGGFEYIPGSHQANFPMPKDLQDYTWRPECAVQPAVRAGSALIFTEALVHGTRPWKAQHDRYVLFYKYLPGYMAQGRNRLEQRTALLTEEQKAYVELGQDG